MQAEMAHYAEAGFGLGRRSIELALSLKQIYQPAGCHLQLGATFILGCYADARLWPT